MKSYFEKYVYWSVWTISLLYSTWSFYCAVCANEDNLNRDEFVDGWTFLNRKKDASYIEWVVFIDTFQNHAGKIMLQVFISQVIFRHHPNILPMFYSLYSIGCLWNILGIHVACIFILYITLMIFIHTTGNKPLCYGINFIALLSLQWISFSENKDLILLNTKECFLADVGIVWLVARCISFSIDRIEMNTHKKLTVNHICLIFAYCLYLPAIFTGPILNFQTFADKMVSHYRPWILSSFIKEIRSLAHPIFGYFLLEFLLHYMYPSMHTEYEFLESLDIWSLCGLAYILPTLFYLKYFVIYGGVRAVAGLEHFTFPPPPKCISRINLPSILWRTFDRGLYLWLVKYIYLPPTMITWLPGGKFIGLILSFSFICIWHGLEEGIRIWCILNFFGVLLEMLTSLIVATDIVKSFEEQLSSSAVQRFNAILALPNFLLLCISSTYFLADVNFGYLVTKKVILGGAIPLIPLMFIMYCGSYVACDIEEKPISKVPKKKRKRNT